ncbi:MAG: c-type cytochrome [Polaromonas sp.]|nr:c-type cytochrome [Polaromonas sp.]
MRIAIAFAVLAALAVAGAAGGALFVFSGAYNVAATSQHLQPVADLLELTMRQSVRLRASSLAAPAAPDAASAQRGAACYQALCVQCHGGPGVAQNDIGKSMQPVPGPLVDAMQRWRPRELYWITRHGIKMSGMPAWSMRLDDQQIWDTVAFIERLPTLSPQAFAEITRRSAEAARPSVAESTPAVAATGAAGVTGAIGAAGAMSATSTTASAAANASTAAVAAAAAAADCPQREPPLVDAGRPDGGLLQTVAQSDTAERGRIALSLYACTACHTIPGVTSSHPNVGPPLAGLARRALIAGRLPNTPDNLVRWLREPQAVKPLTAMPSMGVTEAHAREIAAYLATLD